MRRFRNLHDGRGPLRFGRIAPAYQHRELDALQATSNKRKPAMPLTPYLNEAVFNPKDIEALNAAFTTLCRSLDLAEGNNPRAEAVARLVIEIAGAGERDPQAIHDRVLLALDARNQRSA